MAISKIEDLELTFFLDRLAGVVDFNKDLPMKVFTSGGLRFGSLSDHCCVILMYVPG